MAVARELTLFSDPQRDTSPEGPAPLCGAHLSGSERLTLWIWAALSLAFLSWANCTCHKLFPEEQGQQSLRGVGDCVGKV